MPKRLCKISIGSLLALIAVLVCANIAVAQKADGSVYDVYRINSQKSDIRLLIYRGGMLSTFGHNHVISARTFKGTIQLRPKLAQSTVQLEIPVAKLVVDDAAARGKEGKGFASQPSKDDIAGTRDNMLGSKLLNATKFPTIKITGTSGPVGSNKTATVNVTVALLGRKVKLALPATLKLEGSRLEVSGELSLTHKQLGLKPFTALLGALRVAEKMNFKYRLVAEKVAK